jgi:hypothetical protein
MEQDVDAVGINWLFYAPQFHVGIAIVALVCLGVNLSTWSKVRKIESEKKLLSI